MTVHELWLLCLVGVVLLAASSWWVHRGRVRSWWEGYGCGWDERWDREDNAIRRQLARGLVLRARADGTPAWVAEQLSCACRPDEPGHPGPGDFEDCHCRCHDDDETALAAPDAEPDRAGDAGRPDWRQQVTEQLSALDEPPAPIGLAAVLDGLAGPGLQLNTAPIAIAPRTPWMRDRTLENAREWERFEAELAEWSAGVAGPAAGS